MDIVKSIQKDIKKIKGRKTKLYRDVARTYKKEINEFEILDIYDLCESLLDTKGRGEITVAYQIIFDVYKKYDENTFDVLETWLYKYIEDWWDCDDLMTHAFQYELIKHPENMIRLKEWVKHEKFAVRRSAPVILIRLAQKGLVQKDIIFEICDLLMDDPHYLVQKGYGWLLKESTKHYHDPVVAYLTKNVSKMTRTAYRYALEKLPKEEKEKLMKI